MKYAKDDHVDPFGPGILRGLRKNPDNTITVEDEMKFRKRKMFGKGLETGAVVAVLIVIAKKMGLDVSEYDVIAAVGGVAALYRMIRNWIKNRK